MTLSRTDTNYMRDRIHRSQSLLCADAVRNFTLPVHVSVKFQKFQLVSSHAIRVDQTNILEKSFYTFLDFCKIRRIC